MRWSLLWCLCLSAGLLGCGRGEGGLPVTGTVTLDGQPLPWGQVYLHGKVDEHSNTSQKIFEVRDGSFGLPDGPGLPEGDYTVTILVHEGTAPPLPAEDATGEQAAPPEPTVVGEWEGPAKVVADQPLSFDIKQSDLKPPEGSAS